MRFWFWLAKLCRLAYRIFAYPGLALMLLRNVLPPSKLTAPSENPAWVWLVPAPLRFAWRWSLGNIIKSLFWIAHFCLDQAKKCLKVARNNL